MQLETLKVQLPNEQSCYWCGDNPADTIILPKNHTYDIDRTNMFLNGKPRWHTKALVNGIVRIGAIVCESCVPTEMPYVEHWILRI